MNDEIGMTEHSLIQASESASDGIGWKASWMVEKWHNAGAADVRSGAAGPPDEVINRQGNLLLLGGADILWKALTSTLGVIGTTGVKNTVFDNANAAILVGDSNTAAANTQVDLQASSASTDREIAPMEATYPLHSTGDGSTANRDVTFRGVFSTSMANFSWQEWGIGNSTSSTAPFKGRLLNRKVESLGTKTNTATWTFTVKLSLS